MKTIPLTQGKVALVSNKDYRRLAAFKWHAGKRKNTWYAFRREGRTMVAMHRQIVGAEGNEQVDHRNSNGLDNQRRNLRRCSALQNRCNMRPRGATSRFKGVSWSKEKRKWVAKITVNYKAKLLGRFVSEVDAAKVYDLAAKRHYGRFAYLNFP